MNISEQTEEYVKKLLQKSIRFKINNKILREGRLILYNIKDFYVTFMFITKKGQTKTYEIPLPFRVYSDDTSVIFDYSIKYVHINNKKIESMIDELYIDVSKKSKFFDNTLSIEFVESSEG